MSSKNKNKNKNKNMNKSSQNQKLKSLGLKLNSDPVYIPIIVEHIGMSTMNILLVNNINTLLSNMVGIDIALYVMERQPPAIEPTCPVYDIKDIKDIDCPVIAIDTLCCHEAINHYCKEIYHYCFSVDFTKNKTLLYSDIKDCFINPNIKGIFTRCSEYKKFLDCQFGVNVKNQYVQDCEIQEIIKHVKWVKSIC